jgi:hypothetical protein
VIDQCHTVIILFVSIQMSKSEGIVNREGGKCNVMTNVVREVSTSNLTSCSSKKKDACCFNARHFFYINLLKPTGHVMHQQFNIQLLYVLPPTLYLCVLYLSENKQRLVPLIS